MSGDWPFKSGASAASLGGLGACPGSKKVRGSEVQLLGLNGPVYKNIRASLRDQLKGLQGGLRIGQGALKGL